MKEGEQVKRHILLAFIKRVHNILKPWYILLLFLLLWQMASALEIWNAYLLPPPGKTARTFWKMLLRGEIANSIAISLRRVLTGFSISFTLAFICGVATAYLPNTMLYFRLIGNFFRNVPPLALISLLILWFGLGETSKLIIIILASFFPMELNIMKGFSSVDRRLLEVAESFGLSTARCFLCVSLPAARDDILVGMRVGLGYCWRALIGAEMFASAAGLGYMIVFAQQMSQSDKVLIGIILIGGIGCLTDWLFSLLIQQLRINRDCKTRLDSPQTPSDQRKERDCL